MHTISDTDRSLLQAFENYTLDVNAFHHREHVRLAYILLVLNDVSSAHSKMRSGLTRLLSQNGIDIGTFHETLTFAWIKAVKHCMYLTSRVKSSEEFLALNHALNDKDSIFNHYSRELIAADLAKRTYVPPDLEPIPEHGD